jgi:hypothetical protein
MQVIHKIFSDIHHPDLVNCRESLVKSTITIWINLEVCFWTLRIHQLRSSRVEQGRACHHQRV